MNKPIDDFKDYIVEDVLGHIEDITAKKMFGGYCLYQAGRVFALITSDTDLFFKVNETNQARYEVLGSHPFVYTGHKHKKPVTMPYWHVPEEIMEDRERITDMVYESAALNKRK